LTSRRTLSSSSRCSSVKSKSMAGPHRGHRLG
jgi:hypothetical protein